jgi:hypothetical protein
MMMTDETTTSPEVMAGDVITRPGLYESRGGDLVQITGWEEGWWVSEWNGTVDWYGSDGRQRFDGGLEPNRWDLLHWVRPLPANEVEPETTSEQLAEIEGQADTVQVREGRWLTRNGDIRNVTPTPEGDEREERWPWLDAEYGQTWGHDGRYFSGGDSPLDLVGYLGPIEPEDKTQEPQPADTVDELQSQPDTELQAQVTFLKGREVTLGTRLQQEREVTTRLRSEVSYVQNLLGSEKRRVGELEELVTSLRTINAAQEKAVDAAGKENTALRRQLAVVKEELTTAAAVSHQLQIELDAAQQVPADSPELQQLRLRLADMTLDRDQCKTAYDQIFADLVTIRETTTAETVEAIVEWLQPFRGCNSPALALLLLEALPHIMRHLTGLAQD